MTRPQQEQEQQQDEVQILDPSGCLTLEAMCFTSQLQPEQRAVVERHVRTCAICAQQQMDLARITERLRGARPRVPVPVEAKTLARQAALKSLALRRGRAEKRLEHRSTARLRSISRSAMKPWYHSRTFWIPVLVGMASALLLAAIVLLLL